MKAKVYRFRPEEEAPHYDEFQVEFKAEDRKTVMDFLEYIGDHLDGTLSFYSHSACRQGICGRCAVRVNGSVQLACNTVLTGEDVVLEPAGGCVIKDLVTRQEKGGK